MIPYATAAEAEAALGRAMTWAEAAWFRYSAATPDYCLYCHNVVILLVVYTLAPLPLALLELRPTPISTRGYETLLRLVDNTCSDSFDLYNGLFMYNKNSTELLNRLEWAMDSVKKKLFDGLHDVLRKQLFEGSAQVPSTSNVRK